MFTMEKIEIKVLNNVKADAIRNHRLFKWELVEEKPDLKETTLVFQRDNTVSYYKELVKLEKDFNKIYSIPSWISYIVLGITLIYVTIIAILWLTHVINVDKSIIAIIIAIPAGVMLLVNVFLTFLRNKEYKNHIEHIEDKYQKYQKKVDKLTNQVESK